jgi:hypothetical protein
MISGCFCCCLILSDATVAPNSELTVRTTSSTDIQVCVDAVLSSERDAVQTAVLSTLTVGLSSSAVYPLRRYTTGTGGTCYLFVYQGVSPDAARSTAVLLSQLAPNSAAGTLPIIYKNAQIQVRLRLCICSFVCFCVF